MISVFDLFKIGVGPSSSHTVGPMKAAAAFAAGLAESGAIARVASVEVTLFGSLAFTGRGHATDRAVVLGLCGLEPETIDLNATDALVAEVRQTNRLPLGGRRSIGFDPERAIVFNVVDPPPRHPNTLRLVARDEAGASSRTRPGFRSAAASSCATARRTRRRPATRPFPILSGRAPSCWRAQARRG